MQDEPKRSAQIVQSKMNCSWQGICTKYKLAMQNESPAAAQSTMENEPQGNQMKQDNTKTR